MVRPLAPEDVLCLEIPGEPTISPDGRQVVYVLRTTDAAADVDRHALWSVRATAEGWAAPARLTSGTADTCPVFSPDGGRIAFLRGGDGPPQVHLLPVDGGEAEQVTALPLGAGRPAWSPDGVRIAFPAPVRRGPEQPEHAPLTATRLGYKADGAGHLRGVRQHVHVLDLASGTVRQITDGDWHAGLPAWSRDGTRLAFAAGTDPDADLTHRTPAHVVDVPGDLDGDGPLGGALRRVGDGAGSAGPLVWTTDGTALLVAGRPTVSVGHNGLLRYPLEGTGAPVDLAAPLDRNVMPGGPGYPGGLPQLTRTGEDVVFCVRDRGCSHLYVAAVDGGGAPRPLVTGADVVVAGLSVAGGADAAAVVLADPRTFGEVAVVDLPTGQVTRLTGHTAACLPEVELVEPRPRTFSVHDGTEVHGWLLVAPGTQRPAPLLLDVHGGPHNAWSPVADAAHAYHQALVAAGWAVLLLNPRGSDGYGREFFTGAVGGWGTADEHDFLDPLDALVAEGVADPTRLAVTGYSYGGYMTCWLTGRTDRFAAAVAGGVVADLTSMTGTSDAGRALALEYGDPVADPEGVRARSPLTHVHGVLTPTLVMQGGADERCPVGQAEQWFTALRTRGVPTELVLFPGGSHLFILDGRPSHRVEYSRRLVAWTQRHVFRPVQEHHVVPVDDGALARRAPDTSDRIPVPSSSPADGSDHVPVGGHANPRKA